MAVCEEAVLVAVGHQLRAGLGIGIGVEAVQRLIFPVAPLPLIVMVNLVGGDVQKAFYALAAPDTFKNVDRSHNIGLVGIGRVFVAVPDNGLSRQVEHDLRLRRLKSSLQFSQVPNVADDRGHFSLQAGKFKQVGICGGLQRVAGHFCTGLHQDAAQPGALEAGVAGNKDPFASVEIKVNIFHFSSQIFQGAFPVAQSFSSFSFSRTVSMHCQKPLWV